MSNSDVASILTADNRLNLHQQSQALASNNQEFQTPVKLVKQPKISSIKASSNQSDLMVEPKHIELGRRQLANKVRSSSPSRISKSRLHLSLRPSRSRSEILKQLNEKQLQKVKQISENKQSAGEENKTLSRKRRSSPQSEKKKKTPVKLKIKVRNYNIKDD